MSEFSTQVTATHKAIAHQFKIFRQGRGLTQNQLTQQLGAPVSFIGKCEQQGRRIIVGEFFRTCTVLNVNPVEFIKRIVAGEAAPLSELNLTDEQATLRLNEANLKQSFKANVDIIGEFTGAHLKAVRKAPGFTMVEVAAKIAVIHSFVGKIEGYDRRLDIAEFIHYCIAMEKDAPAVLSAVLDLVNEHAITITKA
jgi:transcriptional regulator with XRE-family HTH domain